MSGAGYDAIVLGGGAAGLMCAATAGQRGRRVLVIDHADEVGKKILISGGGRCNFTNVGTAPERFLSANPHFARSALSRYTAGDFVALVERYGIAWHEKTLGQLFCDGSAKAIVAMLMDECSAGGVEVACGNAIDAVDHADGLYRVQFGTREARAPALVIATGGPSIPKMGATGFAYDLARKFGLKVVEPRPGLVPLTLAGEELLFRELWRCELPRGGAVHPSRTVGTGDFAGFVLLAAWPGGGDRFPSRAGCGVAGRGQARGTEADIAAGAGRGASRTAGGGFACAVRRERRPWQSARSCAGGG
jgi:hypothetical protein